MGGGLLTRWRSWGAIVITLAGLWTGMPAATAEPCPDIGVAFARGTGEWPGVGNVGQSFVDNLGSQAFPRTVGVYGVNYPASSNFGSGLEFELNVADGIRDLANHVRGVLSVCPNTRMVLGGYSQGAAVAALTTSGVVPQGVPPAAAPVPIAPDLADHVDAVVLFGKPSGQAQIKYGVPAIDVGPLYAGKSLVLCAVGDTVCSGDGANGSSLAHGQYGMNGMAAQAAAFVVGRLAPPAPVL